MDWREVPGHPGYEVSEDGDLRRNTPARGAKQGKVLSAFIKKTGYRDFVIRRDGKHVHLRGSHAVALAFIGPKPFPKAEVCHNDGVRTHDHYKNLRWDTRKGNHADKLKHGTLMRGESHPSSVIDHDGVEGIFEHARMGWSQKEIGVKFGVGQAQVSRILNGKRWAHIVRDMRPGEE